MGISVRDGKFLSGARRVFNGYFGYADLYGISSTTLSISSVSLDELSLLSSSNISVSSNNQGLYYVDMYIPIQTAGSFTVGDSFDLAWYNITDVAYTDIEDFGYGHNFSPGIPDGFCRHSLMLQLLSGKSYNLTIRNNSATDYYTSDGFIRMYKL